MEKEKTEENQNKSDLYVRTSKLKKNIRINFMFMKISIRNLLNHSVTHDTLTTTTYI